MVGQHDVTFIEVPKESPLVGPLPLGPKLELAVCLTENSKGVFMILVINNVNNLAFFKPWILQLLPLQELALLLVDGGGLLPGPSSGRGCSSSGGWGRQFQQN